MSRQGTFHYRLPTGSVLAVLFACLLFMPGGASAAEQVGRVLVAVGGVTAEQEDASARGLGRRDPIYVGDRIRTGTRGRVQIRFEDGAMVDLDPSSTFEVEEYASEDDDDGGSAVMSFLRGAMRTITGAIGGNRGDDYRMNTTVATIGVRGTAYALEYCDGECADDGGSEGLYGRVDEGGIEVDGPGGSGGFGEGQYFFVPDGGAPERIVAPPDGILGGDGETGAGGGDDRIGNVGIRPQDTGTETGLGLGSSDNDLLDPDFESGEDTDLGDLRPGEIGDVFFAGGVIGGEDGEIRDSAFILSPDDGDVRLESGAVVGAEFPNAGFVDASDASLTTGSTTFGSGADAFDIDWGWWQGAIKVTENEEDGSGAFAYAFTDPLNMTPQSELSGLAKIEGLTFYGASQGGVTEGPGGFDASGGSWTVSSLGLYVSFLQSEISLTDFVLSDDSTALDMTLGETTGEVDILGNSAVITGLSDGGSHTGELRGKFVGGNAEGLILRFDISGDHEITGVTIAGEGDGV